jgi:hypothetical protein
MVHPWCISQLMRVSVTLGCVQASLGSDDSAMQMVASDQLRYSAALVQWTDSELNRLHKVWLMVHWAAWRLSPGFPSALFVLPEKQGGIPLQHPRVLVVQALTTHIKQLCALPDELCQATRPLTNTEGYATALGVTTSASSLSISTAVPDCTTAENMLRTGGPN